MPHPPLGTTFVDMPWQQFAELPPGSTFRVHGYAAETITLTSRGEWRFPDGSLFPPDVASSDNDYLLHVGTPGDVPYDPTEDETTVIAWLRTLSVVTSADTLAEMIERGEHRK